MLEKLKKDIKEYNTPFNEIIKIVPAIEYKMFPEVSLRMIYEYYRNGWVKSYTILLQRIKQKKEWEKNEFEKARSYIYKLLTSGTKTTHMFKWIQIRLAIEEFQKKIDNTPEKLETSLDLYKVVLNELIKWEKQGCEYLSFDGQNRLTFSIEKFLLGELEWYLNDRGGNPLSIDFEGPDGINNLTKLKFIDLVDDYKISIESIKVILCVAVFGSIESLTKDLVTDNLTTTWNDFEQVIIEPHPVCISILHGFKEIPEFELVLRKIGGLKAQYHREKKGWERIVMELIQYETFNEIDLDFNKMTNKQNTEEIEKGFKKIKEFIRFLAKNMKIDLKTNEVFRTKELFRNFYILIKELSNKKMKKKIGLNNISNPKKIYSEYVLFDIAKKDKKKNKKDFQKYISPDGKESLLPKAGSYAWAQKGIDKKALDIRKQKIGEFVDKNYQRWIDEGYLSKKSNESPLTESKKTAIIYSAKRDVYGYHGDDDNLDPFEDKTSVDHVKQQGSREGTHDEELVATTRDHNSTRVK